MGSLRATLQWGHSLSEAVMLVLFVLSWLTPFSIPLLLAFPLLNAIFRSAIGEEQIRRACHGKTPRFRQLLLAFALIQLLLFDIVVAMVMLSRNKTGAWIIEGCLYSGYLICLALALRRLPMTRNEEPKDDES